MQVKDVKASCAQSHSVALHLWKMFENGRAENIVVHVDHLQKEEFECVFAHMLSLVFVPTKSSESEFANTCAHIVQVVFRVR